MLYQSSGWPIPASKIESQLSQIAAGCALTSNQQNRCRSSLNFRLFVSCATRDGELEIETKWVIIPSIITSASRYWLEFGQLSEQRKQVMLRKLGMEGRLKISFIQEEKGS
jgi:hypothetical protein